MERLTEQKSTGLNGNGLRAIAMILLVMGIFGRGFLQSHMLGLGSVTAEELLTAMQNSQTTMLLVTVSLVCQAMETCAVPLFAFLLVEGFRHTSDLKRYVLRVLTLALVSEIPFNLALSGKLLDFSSRNPVFALVLALVMLYLFGLYAEKSARNTFMKALVAAAALIWPMMLRIEDGICLVFLVWILWAFHKKPTYRNLAGAGAAMVCSLVSPFYLASPMSLLAVHFYNGEEGDTNRSVKYLAYPVALLVVAVLRLVF